MSAGSPSSSASSDSESKLRLPASCDPPTESNPAKEAVWIIFGATGHIGRSLVRAALGHGDKVTAVGRQYESTLEQMSNWHDNCHGLLCDVRVRETVDAVVKQSVERWGRVDIIVNCTGYGVVAAAEDQTEDDLQNQFHTNFTGTLHILHASLPYFRTNKIPGRYLIYSSTSGALGVPGLAPYCATKYAVEGLIESMHYETDCYGIKATLVEPGYVRLDDDDEGDAKSGGDQAQNGSQPDASAAMSTNVESSTHQHHHHHHHHHHRSHVPLPSQSKLQTFSHFRIAAHPSPPYASATSPSGHAKRTFIWFNKRQPTSAIRSAELVWQLGHCSFPPLRLLLGNYAVESIRDRLRCVIEEIEDWKVLHFPVKEGEGGARMGSEAATGATADEDEEEDAEMGGEG